MDLTEPCRGDAVAKGTLSVTWCASCWMWHYKLSWLSLPAGSPAAWSSSSTAVLGLRDDEWTDDRLMRIVRDLFHGTEELDHEIRTPDLEGRPRLFEPRWRNPAV